VWAPRDEADNFNQKHDSELIKEEKRLEVENEIRLQVDELMRTELKNLKLVHRAIEPLQRMSTQYLLTTLMIAHSVKLSLSVKCYTQSCNITLVLYFHY